MAHFVANRWHTRGTVGLGRSDSSALCRTVQSRGCLAELGRGRSGSAAGDAVRGLGAGPDGRPPAAWMTPRARIARGKSWSTTRPPRHSPGWMRGNLVMEHDATASKAREWQWNRTPGSGVPEWNASASLRISRVSFWRSRAKPVLAPGAIRSAWSDVESTLAIGAQCVGPTIVFRVEPCKGEEIR